MKFGFREIIFLVVLLAVPIVSLFYVFKPRSEEIQRATKEIQVKQARLDQLAEMTRKIDDLELAIEEGRESIRLIEAKLPSERDVEGILEQVWLIAKRNDLSVKGVKTEKPVPAALYRELPLRMVVEGQFDGFYSFLLEMENLPRITRVHQLEVERLTTTAAQRAGLPPSSMTAEFLLSIYFESDDVTSLAAES